MGMTIAEFQARVDDLTDDELRDIIQSPPSKTVQAMASRELADREHADEDAHTADEADPVEPDAPAPSDRESVADPVPASHPVAPSSVRCTGGRTRIAGHAEDPASPFRRPIVLRYGDVHSGERAAYLWHRHRDVVEPYPRG